jgi:hypothetical protein
MTLPYILVPGVVRSLKATHSPLLDQAQKVDSGLQEVNLVAQKVDSGLQGVNLVAPLVTLVAPQSSGCFVTFVTLVNTKSLNIGRLSRGARRPSQVLWRAET